MRIAITILCRPVLARWRWLVYVNAASWAGQAAAFPALSWCGVGAVLALVLTKAGAWSLFLWQLFGR